MKQLDKEIEFIVSQISFFIELKKLLQKEKEIWNQKLKSYCRKCNVTWEKCTQECYVKQALEKLMEV